MARGSRFVWIPFLLSCVFQASDNRHVQQEEIHLNGPLGNPEVDDILSKILITLPEGIDPRNINVTSIISKTCTGMKEQLAHLNIQFQQTTHRISQLDDEAFGLRGEVRLLKLQLATCSSTASAIAGSYQTQLLSKMNQLLGTIDSDTFLIMKIISLTREVNSSQRKVQHAANGTETNHISGLQREQQEKSVELSLKTQQTERSHTNSALILQIISLQNQIWDLDQAELRRGDLQPNKTILPLQEQLDRKISELRGKGDAHSAVLELISVNSKIAAMQRLINVHIEESRTNAADYQRQWRQKVELLKGKILQLNRDDRNKELTKQILVLQSELEHFRELMMNAKKTTDSKLKELRIILGAEKKKEENLQKQLEEAEYSQAQLIIKIISIMKEVRELDGDEQHQTSSTSQTTTLQTLLQAKEKGLAKAQAEINELQRKLRLKSEECPGLEERYQEVKTELEQKIAELNRTGDSKAALILNVMNLHEDLKTLTDLISTAEDPDKISGLQRQLEKKQHELNSQIERRIPNPKIFLLIIKLQNELWDLEKNETTGGHVEELQSRVDGLISEIEDKEVDNTKRMLKIMTLQSQVERLQRQLLQTTQVTQLTNELTTKKDELQKYVNDLNEKNPANAQLILTITDLQNQLRKLEKERPDEGQTTSAAVTKLREQLTAKVEEHSRDQAEINALQNKLNQTKAQCSSFDHTLNDLQNDLDVKMKELQSDSGSVTSLALQVSTLTLQLEELQRRLRNTESETKRNEQKLQKMIDEKNNELTKKTAELKARSAQPQRLLQIIAIQTDIDKLVNVAANETNYDKIRALQDHLNYLIDGIQNENNENTKLMFKILAQRDEIARLEKQEKSQTQAALERIKDLEDELEHVRNQIKEETSELDSSDTRIANLSAQIMELHKKIKPLEDEISDLKETSDENVRELQTRLHLTKRQLQDSELLLKDADTKNFNLIMEVADLRTQLKKAQKQASQAAENNIDELKQLLQTQQRENKRLKNTNKDLKQEVKELKMCCADDVNTQCDDLQRQLQQSQEDADRLQQQLHKKEATLKQLQRELKEQNRENNTRQHEYSKLQAKLRDVEDKTISARRVTLDPNTAHPRIALSVGNTEITTSDVTQDVPDHPGRFDVSLAILGTTGFSTGRHYWEVSVAGKLCYHLGMASESSQRKGAIIFNPTNGFWTVVLNRQGQYRAIDRSVVGIPVQTLPLTLGILLDYKKGMISFYDAGARSHMYSFVGQRFTGKIYPFINLCVEDVESQTPIVSLPPGSVDWIK
ncbi:putative leucine-rich repeat-containing protein DDB_G0290503 isoform X2 [Anarrhichthys ocellatus]|uniref:putative leucine-rich repeat-containing protein DDB_G0290503 isoform X2 n=1 Tax=Anarrhichthys ocellatus TaxID=433405 RepID=UPI0012EE8843|nr:putative leucine-rich repeat-containing protein DDB_G0290503 isoform X2 [Anarrhichthys ocellatus]